MDKKNKEKTAEITQQISEVEFSWSFPEYVQYRKNIWWYLVTLLILVALVWWSVADSNYMFASFLVLFYLVIIIYENREPDLVDFFITPDGIKFGKSFYFYKEFESFFIIYEDDGIKNLYFDFKNPIRGRLTVPLDGQDAVSVREYLLQFLVEDLDRESEPFSEKLRRWLKF